MHRRTPESQMGGWRSGDEEASRPLRQQVTWVGEDPRAGKRAPRRIAGGLERIGHEHLVHARQASQRRTVVLPRESSEAHDAQPERSHPHRYIRGTNMMCAFGVPGCIIQGPPSTGAAERPVDAAVA